MNVPPLTSELAAFVAEARPDASARYAAQARLGRALRAARTGSRAPITDAALRVTAALGGPEEHAVLGRDERRPLPHAALVNAVSMLAGAPPEASGAEAEHVLVSAALAAAEHAGASGEQLLDALAVGSEIGMRIVAALPDGHAARGWDVPATTARFAVTGAVARLLATAPTATVVALGLAATEAAGLRAALGSDVGLLQRAHAASDGVEGVLLATGGFNGPAAPIEGRRGFAAVMAPGMDVAGVLVDLGTTWRSADDTSAVGMSEDDAVLDALVHASDVGPVIGRMGSSWADGT